MLDSTTLGTDDAAPYVIATNLNGFANGSHQLSATVTDMFGRQVTITKTVTLDKTPLTISSFTRNYATFYPIKRDKYYDNLTITFYASKACPAKVLITNSAGALVLGINKTAVAGKNSVTWDGKWAHDHKAHTGTYYIQVTASDTSGNTFATGKLKTVIKNYLVVKLSHNRVKIIAR
jgi:flagellar hook assembly protein FlgD